MSASLNKPRLLEFVGSIEKGHRECIDVALREYSNRPGVDVRVHGIRHGDHVPTPRGVVVGLADLRSVIRLLLDAERAAVARGLLPEPRT